MDSKTLHDRFRRQLTNVHALTVATVSLFEIIGYIILVFSGVEAFALDNAYLWYGVVAPIIVNVVTHIVARCIVKSPTVSRKRKNQSIIAAALITSLVVAVIHKEYTVTGCAFIFPMMLSAMFNDKKLLNTSFLASIFILLCVVAAFWLDKAITLTTALNLFILFGFAWISYLCGKISINFSKQAYTTIDSQAQENDKLMEVVRKDQMTGLYNHNTFITHLDKIVSGNHSEAICLVMLDVDDFKTINDTYGHDCGDMVLIRIAKMLKKHCGIKDVAYRYGGEEFAVIFKGKTEAEVCSIMQSVLNTFRTYKFSFTKELFTFSAGVARFKKGMTQDNFFDAADQTLYDAKHQGKNRILLAKEFVEA